jgi:2-phosphoglycerate kinase
MNNLMSHYVSEINGRLIRINESTDVTQLSVEEIDLLAKNLPGNPWVRYSRFLRKDGEIAIYLVANYDDVEDVYTIDEIKIDRTRSKGLEIINHETAIDNTEYDFLEDVKEKIDSM